MTFSDYAFSDYAFSRQCRELPIVSKKSIVGGKNILGWLLILLIFGNEFWIVTCEKQPLAFFAKDCFLSNQFSFRCLPNSSFAWSKQKLQTLSSSVKFIFGESMIQNCGFHSKRKANLEVSTHHEFLQAYVEGNQKNSSTLINFLDLAAEKIWKKLIYLLYCLNE